MDTRLLHPWDFLGKSVGVCCHFLLQGTSRPRDRTQVSHIVDRCFTIWANREVHSSIPGSGRCSGEGIGYPLQYSWASLVAQMIKNLPAMWETWVWTLAREDPQEEGTATHSSLLAWRIPWTEEPGGLQSMELQRVGHDWAIKHSTAATYGDHPLMETLQISILSRSYPLPRMNNIDLNYIGRTVWACMRCNHLGEAKEPAYVQCESEK